MLDGSVPCYQVGLGNRLCYELMFNDYNRVINSLKTNATYKITAISLEYEIVSQPSTLQDLPKLNMMEWLCCMREFSDTGRL